MFIQSSFFSLSIKNWYTVHFILHLWIWVVKLIDKWYVKNNFTLTCIPSFFWFIFTETSDTEKETESQEGKKVTLHKEEFV